MARVWAGFPDVDEAVTTIQTCIKTIGKVPDALVRAYWTSIERSGHGLVQRFYEKLAKECPQALPYFTDKPKPEEGQQT